MREADDSELTRSSAWRPLYNPIEDWPLAFCDGSTVNEDDLIATDHVRRHHVGEVLYARYNPAQKWYYLKHQKRNEVVLLKNFDSDPLVAAKCKCILFS